MSTGATITQDLVAAQKRVARIKDFYQHLKLFSITTIMLFIIKADIFKWFLNSAAIEPGYKEWIAWNMLSIPIIWSVILLIHGLVVFRIKIINWKRLKPKALRDWEQTKINQILQDEL